ncbi:MAG: DUF4469 domain-containing protein [Spirochaetaceae bacterium]|jgi:hypothetical protein|nr:DUF4469 domain-containing protein [Spirochaetaceae bacterium]
MLEYSLHDNALAGAPEDMSAQIHPTGSYNREAFINLMLQRGTLVTKTDIVAVFNNMEETALSIIQNGGTINLPLLNTSFSITGVFEGAADVFDSERHKVNILVRKGKALKELEDSIQVSKVSRAPLSQPIILEVKDSTSGTTNAILTPNGVVKIQGSTIKLAGDKEAVGLYFVSETGTEFKATNIITNKPSQLIAAIPALTPGMYRIKIVTQHTGGKNLKTPKATVYDKLFTVA